MTAIAAAPAPDPVTLDDVRRSVRIVRERLKVIADTEQAAKTASVSADRYAQYQVVYADGNTSVDCGDL